MSQNDWSTGTANSQQGVDYSTVSLMHLATVKAADLSPADFIIVRDRLLSNWQDQKRLAAQYKENELSTRNMFVNFASDPTKTKGTENLDLGNGWKAAMVKKESTVFVKDAEGKTDLNVIRGTLDSFCNFEGGRMIAERLVKWTPELSMSEYKLLPPEMKVMIDAITETKAGTPTLEIKAPKSAS